MAQCLKVNLEKSKMAVITNNKVTVGNSTTKFNLDFGHIIYVVALKYPTTFYYCEKIKNK